MSMEAQVDIGGEDATDVGGDERLDGQVVTIDDMLACLREAPVDVAAALGDMVASDGGRPLSCHA
jgi:hypothetical protein